MQASEGVPRPASCAGRRDGTSWSGEPDGYEDTRTEIGEHGDCEYCGAWWWWWGGESAEIVLDARLCMSDEIVWASECR